jgi:hypothetical protein
VTIKSAKTVSAIFCSSSSRRMPVQQMNKSKLPKHANVLKWFPLAVAGISRLAKQETIPELFPKINPQGALSRLTSLCHSCPAPPNIPKEQVSSQWCPDEGRQTYHLFK